jgi:hypothetical protein
MSKKDDRYKVLERLEKKNGDLVVDDVIEEAKNPNSALHDVFEWDLKKAAHAEWRSTAKRLIREYRFLIVTEEVVRYAPEWVSKSDAKTPTFTRTNMVKKDKARSLDLLQDEIARIISACDRSLALADHFKLRTKFEELLKDAAKIRGFLIELL